MNNKFISKKFQKKASNLKIIGNIYDDKDFSAYYKNVEKDDFILKNDIAYYKRILNKNDLTLEIGSGDGRVFNPLFSSGYNIIGIEPSKEMKKYINPKAQKNIYNITIQNIKLLPKLPIKNIIIPATSISLFPQSDFETFLNYCKQNFKLNHIIFDFLPKEYFENVSDDIMISTFNNEKFYYTNFLSNNGSEVIFNIMNKQKIGISRKYVYDAHYLYELFENLNLYPELIVNTYSYKFISFQGEKNSE